MDKQQSSSSLKRTKTKNISKKTKKELPKVDKEGVVDNKGVVDGAELSAKDSVSFLTRMKPQKLVSLVRALDNCQKEVVLSMGFGFLFHLHSMTVPLKFAKWLVTKFDYHSSGWWFRNNQLLLLAAEDVHLTLGLPIGGVEIVEVGRGKHVKDPDYLISLNEWHEEWGNKGNPNMAEMPGFILSKPGNSISFKRNFIIYVVASLFDRPTNVSCPRSFLKNVLHVDNIKNLDWCKYVCSRVVESVRAYQSGSTTFTGPIVFMMLFYLDRMQYKGKSMIRTFPTISGWTEQSIKNRIKLEEKGNGFGRGIVIPRINHPILRENVTNVPTVEKDDSSKDELDDLSVLQSDITELANCAKKISSVIKEYNTYYKQLRKKYKDSRSTIGTEAIEKVFQVTTTVFESYTQYSQQDVVSDIDDDSWITPDVIQNIDNIVVNEMKKKIDVERERRKSVSHKDNKDQAKETDIEDMMPNFDLGINLSTQDQDANLGNDLCTPLCTITETYSRKRKVVEETPRNEVLNVDNENVEQGGIKQRLRVQPPRTKAPAGVFLCSPYQQRVISMDPSISSEEKLFCKYIFIHNRDNPNMEEPMCTAWNICLDRYKMSTFRPKCYLDSMVIDVWSCYLNHMERRKNPASPTRFYASILAVKLLDPDFRPNVSPTQISSDFMSNLDQSLSLSNWINANDIELAFFPVHLFNNYITNHFVLMVVNMRCHTVDIIDNYIASLTRTQTYGQLPKLLMIAFGNFMMKFNQQKGESIKRFEVNVLNMPWRSKKNVTDCGIFCMRHMETYFGISDWNCGIKKDNDAQLILLRKRYCHFLATMKENTSRHYLRNAVDKFKHTGDFPKGDQP